MNFQTVRQFKGQKDDNGYPVKVDMIGVFEEIGGGAYTPNQKLYCDCKIRDTAQEKHKVRLYVKELIPPGLLNKECSFSISAYDGEYQGKPYVGYSGFWNDKVIPRPQNNPQGQPQRPQTPPQGIKPPPGIDVQSQIIEMAQRFLMAVETLVYPSSAARPTQPSGENPDYVGDEPAPPDDEIPY